MTTPSFRTTSTMLKSDSDISSVLSIDGGDSYQLQLKWTIHGASH